ncbi:MAG: sulfatase, partial [Verrucomicrobiales bacterium]|nr:sulfatase [Verrucomicrobiales bacterium]
MKRIFRRLLPVAAALLPLFSSADDRPNFILYISDDISADDLGCYGNNFVHTPNLDALAERGLRFNNAYLTISSCSPSRCSLITGRYPHNTGAAELHTRLPEGQPLFPKTLRDAGYYTVLSGKHHMGDNADPAFDEIKKGKGPGSQEEWVKTLAARPKDKPFFAWFASYDAHRKWQLNEDGHNYDPAEIEVPPFLFDGAKTRVDLAEYYHEVSRTDHFMGELVAELKRQGIEDNTYIIYMADNGRPFPRCKTRLYDSGIKTPFLMACPGKIQPAVTDSIISTIDLAPTVLELAGIEKIDPRHQGVSFTAILNDPNAVVRDVAFAEHNWHVFQAHERMVRTGDWLFIRNAFPNLQNLCMEGDPTFPAGAELWEEEAKGNLKTGQRDIFQIPRPAIELYHVG